MKTFFCLFSLSAFGVPALFAQQQDPVGDIQHQIKEPARQQKAQTEIEKAVEENRKRQVEKGGPEVTYEQVMANPDDIELNYRYALGQVAKGNLRAAASTLERILLVKKDLPKVKLFYAVILFRLDNLDDAERLLVELKKEEMPDTLRAELDGYIAQIKKKRRKGRVSALFGAGLDYDGNRNAAPASGRRLFFDIPITLVTGTRDDDVAATMMFNVDGEYDLGFQAGHKVFAGVSYYRSEQMDMRTMNLQVYGVNTGAKVKTRWGEFTPSFGFSHLLLAQTTYLRSRDVSGRFDHRFADGINGYVEAGYERDEYNRTWVVTTGDQRTGDKFDLGAGLSLALSPSRKATLGFSHNRTAAIEGYNCYDRETLTLGHTWLLGKGQFLLTSASVNFDRYDLAERAVSVRRRSDDGIRARGTYGLPLGTLWKPLKGVVWTASYEYFQNFSNLESYGYTNNKISTMFTYRWEL
ncbi:MAG: hypothetical protein HY927_14985 [Elusimicrobia bacterium]|nr:hypothetical protein [Elusimicrobiota bacterium]